MLTKNIEVMKREAQRHIAADAVTSGVYWDGEKGCFIGCLAHSSDALAVTHKFGIPEPLVRIAEYIFESISHSDRNHGVEFFSAVPEAIGNDGRDLSKVHWLFLVDCLEHMPKVGAELQPVIDRVIAGLRLLGAGKKWPEAEAVAAARDTHRAAHASKPDSANAAYFAAYYAGNAVYYAANAAVRAARTANSKTPRANAAVRHAAFYAACADAVSPAAKVERQRDFFLSLLREAR